MFSPQNWVYTLSKNLDHYASVRDYLKFEKYAAVNTNILKFEKRPSSEPNSDLLFYTQFFILFYFLNWKLNPNKMTDYMFVTH